MSATKTQRAIVFRKLGPPSVLEEVSDWPVPVPRTGEVLVAIKATSVNPIDNLIRSGKGIPSFLIKLPRVPGADVAGVVDSVPPDTTTDLKIGDKVFGMSEEYGFGYTNGTYAQFAAVPASQLVPIPDGLSFAQAAAVPLAALTAWQAVEAAGLAPGQRLFISAGAGGVGSFAVQIAKARGLHVITSASAAKAHFVKELGADEVFDYNASSFATEYKDKPFDAVIDSRGGRAQWEARSVLKRRGTLVFISNFGYLRDYGAAGYPVLIYSLLRQKVTSLLRLGPLTKLIFVASNGEDLSKIAALISEGKVKPIIDRILPLSKASEAHEYIATERAKGKVVLTVDEEAS